MDDLLNIDEISLKDIVRQLDFRASLGLLDKKFGLKIKIIDTAGEVLFENENKPLNLPEKIKLTLAKRTLGFLMFKAEGENEFVKEYLTAYFNEQVKLGYKIYITNEIHLKLAEESYNELDEKNRELIKVNKALQEHDKIRTNFLAMISHELKTPLTSIIGYTEFLQLEDLSEDAEETLDKILKNALELHDLIKQILDVSKIENGALRIDKKKVDLENFINSVIDSVNYQLRNKNITLEKEIDFFESPVFFDEEKIFQAVRNLLTNAIKFSNKGSKVILKFEKVVREIEDNNPDSENFTFFGAEEADFLKISVKDFGIGIEEKYQDKLFNSFYQVDGTQTREHGGTGLGLAIVKNFVKAHGGYYGLVSEKGKGSTFWIEIPLK